MKYIRNPPPETGSKFLVHYKSGNDILSMQVYADDDGIAKAKYVLACEKQGIDNALAHKWFVSARPIDA